MLYGNIGGCTDGVVAKPCGIEVGDQHVLPRRVPRKDYLCVPGPGISLGIIVGRDAAERAGGHTAAHVAVHETEGVVVAVGVYGLLAVHA